MAARMPALVYAENYGPDVDPRRWVVIYPPYIDKLRKESEVCLSNNSCSVEDVL